MFVSSCSISYESKGDSAYRASQNAVGDVQRKLAKEAYIYYKKAVSAHPASIGLRLRNRFIETTLARAEMVLSEGSAEMDAIPLFVTDVDSMLNPEVDQQLRERYASFLATLADSCFQGRRLYEGIKLLDKSIETAINKAPFEQKKKAKMDNFAKENYEVAEIEMVNGKTNEEPEALIRAEFMVQVAMLYEPEYPGAKELLSELRKLNKGTYSAYLAVVTDKPDTTIFRQINKNSILLAVPVLEEAGRGATLKVEMYNYSPNPQRLRPTNFFVVDTDGKRYPGLPSSKIDKEIVDQEHEAKMILRFSKGGARIQKLVFEGDDKTDYSEKIFF